MFVSAFLFGLLGSLHCIGMCGPIAFMLPVSRTNNFMKAYQIASYHMGRILAYSIIGFIFGLIGKSLSIFGFQQQLSILIGIVMIVIALMPYKTISKYNFSKPVFKIVSKLKSALGASLKKKSPETFLTIGFLNGFLPCGLVYMAVFAAIAGGSALSGSLYMALFGLGTIPLMTSAIYFSNFLKGSIRQKIQKSIPVFVVIIGILFIVRGLGLGIPYLSPEAIPHIVSNNIDCH